MKRLESKRPDWPNNVREETLASMSLEILTAERQLFSDEVDLVIAPGLEGELGILPYHAPLLSALKPGELKVRKGDEDQFFTLAGGFLEVLDNRVTILADAAENVSEIDEQRAQAAVERAQERVAQRGEEIDLERALQSLRRAQIRVQVARQRRTRAASTSGQAGS